MPSSARQDNFQFKQIPDKYVKHHMFIREYFIFGRIINRVDLGIDPYGAAFFVLQLPLFIFLQECNDHAVGAAEAHAALSGVRVLLKGPGLDFV